MANELPQEQAVQFLRDAFEARPREPLVEAVERAPLSMDRNRNRARRLVLRCTGLPGEQQWRKLMKAARLLGWTPQ